MATEAVFTWRIPSIPNTRKHLLCCGYVRENYNNYVTTSIIKMFCQFYSVDLYTMDDIKNAKYGAKFFSPIFMLNSLQFYFECWPNGSNESSIGEVRLYLCLLSLPLDIKSVFSSFKLSLKETNTQDTIRNIIFNKNHWYTDWTRNILKLKDIQDVDTLTFTIQMLNYYTIPAIPLKPPSLSLLSESYAWTVDDPSIVKKMQTAPNVYGFFSPIFELHGFKWFMIFFPNGSKLDRQNSPNLFLALASVPSIDIEVHVKQTLFLGNFDYDQAMRKHGMKTPGVGLTAACHGFSYTTTDLLKLDRFYFVAEITLIDIYQNNKQYNLTKYDEKSQETADFPSEFIWNITENDLIILRGETDFLWSEFEMYGYKWMVTMNENGNISLGLLSPRKKGNIISIRCYISLLELGIRWTMKAIFDWKEDVNDRMSWGDGRISMQKFNQLQKCKIIICMELIDIYSEMEDSEATSVIVGNEEEPQ